MHNYDSFMKMCIESVLPNNTVLYDDKGNPSIMVRVPKFKISDVIDGGSDDVHPAFIVNNYEVPEIFISKYSNVLINDRACSLPNVNPTTEIARDKAKNACENKGIGWHLMSNAEWAAIALWCKKNGFLPRGNNSFGKDVNYSFECGRITYSYYENDELINGKTATGSGPVSWSHDNTTAGIYDMNGNVWAQISGLRFVEGEIQIIPNNDSAAAIDESFDSPHWKAIRSDGKLISPGGSDTLKIDIESNKIFISKSGKKKIDKWSDSLFGTFDSNLEAPEILKSLALYPADETGYEKQKIWCNNTKERLPWRGGTWDAFENSGVFCLFACYERTHISKWAGFRSSYVKL